MLRTTTSLVGLVCQEAERAARRQAVPAVAAEAVPRTTITPAAGAGGGSGGAVYTSIDEDVQACLLGLTGHAAGKHLAIVEVEDAEALQWETPAFDNPMEAAGDLIVGAAEPAGSPARLGTEETEEGWYLALAAGMPAWQAPQWIDGSAFTAHAHAGGNGSKVWTLPADWQSGSSYQADTTTTPGSVKIRQTQAVSLNSGMFLDDDIAATTPAEALNISTNLTVEMWVYFTDSVIFNRSLFYKGPMGGSQGQYSFGFYGEQGDPYGSGDENKLVARLNGQYLPSSNQQAIGATKVTPNAWHHVAFTYDGSRIRIWLDGVLDGTSASDYTGGITGTDTGIYVGTYYSQGYGAFPGLVSGVRVSNSVRYTTTFTPARVWSDDASTVLLWAMAEGSGASVADTSGNGITGTISGSSYTWVAGDYLSLATVTLNHDAGVASDWGTLSWGATVPPSTLVDARTRGASTLAGLSAATWSDWYSASGQSITTADSRLLQVQFRLQSADPEATPTLADGTLAYTDSGQGGTVSHADLSGRDADGHTQYHTDARAATWLLSTLLTTNGDLLTRSGGALARVGVGTSTQVLKGGTVPAFGALASADLPAHGVTFAKFQQVGGPAVIGRLAGGDGDVTALSPADGRSALGAEVAGAAAAHAAAYNHAGIAGAVSHAGSTGNPHSTTAAQVSAEPAGAVATHAGGTAKAQHTGGLGSHTHASDGAEGGVLAAYPLLSGRAGGQTVYGGTGYGEELTLVSTSHTSKGSVHVLAQTLEVRNTNDDNAGKVARIVATGYDNEAFPMMMLLANPGQNQGLLALGGGSGGTTAATRISFYANPTNNVESGTERGRIDGDGNFVWGTAALATNATNGFLYVPTSAGAPTGAPTAYTGRAPLHIDATNGRIYAYYGGAWHYATLT